MSVQCIFNTATHTHTRYRILSIVKSLKSKNHLRELVRTWTWGGAQKRNTKWICRWCVVCPNLMCSHNQRQLKKEKKKWREFENYERTQNEHAASFYTVFSKRFFFQFFSFIRRTRVKIKLVVSHVYWVTKWIR